jgi:ABC-2 type transport system ATP-binding protein
VAANEVYGLLGPNGAGKTTTINILCNLLAADAGIVTIDDQPPSEATKHKIGVAPQEISLYDNITCEQNLKFFAGLYGLHGAPKQQRVQKLVEQFHLQSYRHAAVATLSGGWKRRLNIAVALVNSPRLLVLDEPTVGLDVEARYGLWELIRNLKAAGVAILLTTHYLDEAEKLCSRIGIIQNGRLVAEGSLDELRKIVPAEELAIINTDDQEAVHRRAAALQFAYRHYGSDLTLLLPRKHTLKEVVNMLDGVPLHAVSLQNVRLEHVYMEVTHETNAMSKE